MNTGMVRIWMLSLVLSLAFVGVSWAQITTVGGDLGVSGKAAMGPATPYHNLDVYQEGESSIGNVLCAISQNITGASGSQYAAWMGITLNRGTTYPLYYYPERWFIGMDNTRTSLLIHSNEISPSAESNAIVINLPSGNVGIGGDPIDSGQPNPYDPTNGTKNGPYKLFVHGKLGAQDVIDSTPWPSTNGRKALEQVDHIHGRMSRISTRTTSQTYKLDHATLPDGVRNIETYECRIEGDEADFREYAAQNELEIKGDIKISQAKALDGKSDITYASAQVVRESRSLSAMVSYNVLAIQALDQYRKEQELRVGSIENQIANPTIGRRGEAILGNGKNDVSDLPNSGIVAGSANRISGSNSVVLSGSNNLISGDDVVVAGSDNVCSGSSVVIVGSGNNVTADTVDSYVFGDTEGSPRIPVDSKHAALFFPNNPEGRVAIGTPGSVDGTRLLVAGGDVRVIGGSFIADGKKLVTPDYVFEQGHQVMPISQVDQYIATNGRLPEMPSASEVSEKGLDVAEFQMKLLKKVEELTVYTIDQQKKIDALEAEIKAMKAVGSQ